MSPANPNEIPVVTATWPRRLNLHESRQRIFRVKLAREHGRRRDVPASYPRCKSRVLRRSQNGCPVIRSSSCWDGGHDLGHAGRDTDGEEGDHYPAHRHDSRTPRDEAGLEKGGYTGDD